MRAAAGTVVAEVSVPQLRSNEKRFRGGLVFQTHRLWYHSTLGRQ